MLNKSAIALTLRHYKDRGGKQGKRIKFLLKTAVFSLFKEEVVN
ncbi:MAG: hypothetical protein WBB28_06660 [Crinalium sp.]